MKGGMATSGQIKFLELYLHGNQILFTFHWSWLSALKRESNGNVGSSFPSLCNELSTLFPVVFHFCSKNRDHKIFDIMSNILQSKYSLTYITATRVQFDTKMKLDCETLHSYKRKPVPPQAPFRYKFKCYHFCHARIRTFRREVLLLKRNKMTRLSRAIFLQKPLFLQQFIQNNTSNAQHYFCQLTR